MKSYGRPLVSLLTVVFLLACQDKLSPTQPQALDKTLQIQTQPGAVARAQTVVSLRRPAVATLVARKDTNVSGLSGSYLLTTAESCGGMTSSAVAQVSQVGDQFSFLLGVDTGGAHGTIHGSTIDISWDKDVDAGLLCGSELTGTATVKNGTISGSVFGVSNGHSCFACPSDTITFTLVHQ